MKKYLQKTSDNIDILNIMGTEPEWKYNSLFIYEKESKEIVFLFFGLIINTEDRTACGYTQVFWNYDSDIRIEEPEEFISSE